MSAMNIRNTHHLLLAPSTRCDFCWPTWPHFSSDAVHECCGLLIDSLHTDKHSPTLYNNPIMHQPPDTDRSGSGSQQRGGGLGARLPRFLRVDNLSYVDYSIKIIAVVLSLKRCIASAVHVMISRDKLPGNRVSASPISKIFLGEDLRTSQARGSNPL